MAKSHPAGMQICYATFAGISLRLCSISLRSFRITFAAYLPTHIKSLWDFFQSLLNNHRDNLYIISYLFLTTAQKLFCVFLFRCRQYLSAELASPMPVVLNFCVVEFVRWGYFWGDNNFWGWCYVIGLEFVCAYARIVIFS